MRKSKILLLLLFVINSAFGQDITRHEADSLLRLLDKNQPDTGRINLLLQLAKFQIFKPGEYKQDLDSALILINQAEHINAMTKSIIESGNILLVKAYYLKESGQKELSKKTIDRAILILKNGKNKYLLGEAFFESSFYYSNDDTTQLNKRIDLVRRAVQCFEESGSTEQKAHGLMMLGDLLEQSDKPDQALAALKSSLESFQSIQYEPVQGVHILIGSTYQELGDMSKALNHSLLALQVAEKVKDTSIQLCEINNKIGLIFFSLKEYEKASAYFADALISAEKYNDSASIFQITTNILTTYGLLNKPKEAKKILEFVSNKYKNPKYVYDDILLSIAAIGIYDQLKEFTKAQYFCDRLIKLSHPYDLTTNEWANVYTTVIKFYVVTEQYSLAQKFLHRAESLKDLGLLSKMTINGAGFTLDTAIKNYKSGIMHLLAYKTLNDSIFNEKKSNEIQRLQIQFATTKKENDIKLLSQQTKLQQLELKRAALTKKITLIGLSLLFVIAALIFYQFKLKQRSNKVIQKKNSILQHMVSEKEWLLKEVHHRVKNNLHTVICLLESQAAYLANDALKAIETSQHRIYAMSLIHQKLYQSEDVKAIDMSVYLPEFIRYLDDSFGISGQVDFRMKIESVELGISQAIPVALIINEAVTNSIKYAFPGKRPGIIEINMHQADKQIQLTIADNGIGIDTSIADATSSTTLGMELMKGLSEDINAHIKFENHHGTIITMSFKVDPLDNKTNILNAGKEKEFSF